MTIRVFFAFTQQHAHRRHPTKNKTKKKKSTIKKFSCPFSLWVFAVEGNTVECRFETKSAAL